MVICRKLCISCSKCSEIIGVSCVPLTQDPHFRPCMGELAERKRGKCLGVFPSTGIESRTSPLGDLPKVPEHTSRRPQAGGNPLDHALLATRRRAEVDVHAFNFPSWHGESEQSGGREREKNSRPDRTYHPDPKSTSTRLLPYQRCSGLGGPLSVAGLPGPCLAPLTASAAPHAPRACHRCAQS